MHKFFNLLNRLICVKRQLEYYFPFHYNETSSLYMLKSIRNKTSSKLIKNLRRKLRIYKLGNLSEKEPNLLTINIL